MTTDIQWTRPLDRLLPHALASFDVDVTTGVIRHRHGRFAGRVAGSVTPHGYTVVGINGTQVYAHRLVMFAATGTPPPFTLDHKRHCRDARGADNSTPELVRPLAHNGCENKVTTSIG